MLPFPGGGGGYYYLWESNFPFIIIWEIIVLSVATYLLYRVVNVSVEVVEVTVDVSKDSWSTVRQIANGAKVVGTWLWGWVAYKNQRTQKEQQSKKRKIVNDPEMDPDVEDDGNEEYVYDSSSKYLYRKEGVWKRVKRWIKSQLE